MERRREPHLLHDNYSRPRCSICRAARENAVDVMRAEALLAAGARLKPTAEKFGVNAFALRRHWAGVTPERKNYLKFGARLSQEALAAAVIDEKIATIDHLKLVRAGLHRGFQLALQTNDFSAIANLSRALHENIFGAARLAGEWEDGPRSVTNVAIMTLPGVAGVVANIARALAPFPEAKAKVLEVLRSVESATAALPGPETIDVAE
jgi:hypothetical protein